ncbi:MAG TPA: hypothetical protein VGL00_06870 [Terracidiphilus sp.]
MGMDTAMGMDTPAGAVDTAEDTDITAALAIAVDTAALGPGLAAMPDTAMAVVVADLAPAQADTRVAASAVVSTVVAVADFTAAVEADFTAAAAIGKTNPRDLDLSLRMR